MNTPVFLTKDHCTHLCSFNILIQDEKFETNESVFLLIIINLDYFFGPCSN